MDSEKIYCCDRPNNDFATMALLNNNNANNWNNNPFMYLIWLVFMRQFNGYGNEGENFNSRQISALQDTVNTNHNNDLAMQAIAGNTDAIRELASSMNTSFSNVQMAVCGVKSAIEQVGGAVGFSAERVINAIGQGNLNLIQQLKDCCCNTQQSILKMGYENQLANERQTYTLGSGIADLKATSQLQACQNQGATISRIDQLANGVSAGFSSIGYLIPQLKNDIVTAISADGQATRALLNDHWSQERTLAWQDEKFKNSQLENKISQMEMFNTLKSQMGCSCNC